ncbi:hypothetical protein DFJ74DRAFT_764218, partial [Hyaloraphidium curvatum]
SFSSCSCTQRPFPLLLLSRSCHYRHVFPPPGPGPLRRHPAPRLRGDRRPRPPVRAPDAVPRHVQRLPRAQPDGRVLRPLHRRLGPQGQGDVRGREHGFDARGDSGGCGQEHVQVHRLLHQRRLGRRLRIRQGHRCPHHHPQRDPHRRARRGVDQQRRRLGDPGVVLRRCDRQVRRVQPGVPRQRDLLGRHVLRLNDQDGTTISPTRLK